MRDTRRSAVSLAGAGALAVLLASSAFAADTPRDGQSHDGWKGRQRAASSNDAARNRTQSAPQGRRDAPKVPQNAPQFRQNAPQVQQSANPVRVTETNLRDSRSRNVAPESNRGYQDGRANDTNRNASESNGNGNWSSRERQATGATEQNRSYRDNERVNLAGRVSSFRHEGNGYRVHLDRDGRSFWIPESRLRNRGGDLRVGVSISLAGVFRGGMIDVDAISWPGNYGYDHGYLRGVVERVDYRNNTILVRDEASGRFVNVDMRTAGRASRIDARDLRRGDYLTLSGQWDRGGVFEAYRVDTINQRR